MEKAEYRPFVTFKVLFLTLAIYQWQRSGLSKSAATGRLVKNYNLNVTEVLDSDFKNAVPGIFNFTVGILG